MKKLRNKILSAVLVLSLLLTSSSFAFAVGENDALKYTKISGVSAVGGSSEMNPAVGNEGGFGFAFDGNTATFWHTNWYAGTDPNGYIIFDLGRKVNLSRLEFMPRQDGNPNGRIGQYEISVSSSFDSGMTKETLEGTWSVAATGTWDWTNYTKPNVQQANLTNTLTRYVKLKAITTTASHVCAAEIYCYENTVDPVITVQPESVFSSQNVELTVTAESSAPDATLSYQWYSYNAGETAEDAQDVVDGTSNTINVTPTTDSKFYYVVVTQTNGDIVGTATSDVAEVNAGRTDYKITKESGLSIFDSSSFETEAPPSNALDGDPGTIWHSNWHAGTDGSGFDRERYISVDLGKDYYLSKVRYLPRQAGGNNGRFKDCSVYVSSDGVDWTLLKSAEGWSDTTDWKEINIDIPSKTRYVKVVGVNTYTNESNSENKFATAAEIEFYADTTTETTDIITSQPQGGTIASTGSAPLVLSVGAKEDSSYQWYSNDENSYIGATEISDATQASYTPADETKYYFVKVTNGNKSVNSDIVLVNSTAAKIGDNVYATLSEAINAAQANDTVEVTRNIDLKSDIKIGKNITVKSTEGNNFVLNRTESSKGSTLFTVNNRANVTFENITIDGGAVWSGAEDSVLDRGTTNNGITSTKEFFSVNSNSTLTLNTVTLQNNSRSGNGGVITVDNSTVNINESIIKNNSSTGFSSVMWASKQNSNVVITNSEIFGNKTTHPDTGSTILLEQGANLTISGGEFRNNDGNVNGGAVYLFGESTATVKDNAIISNNKSSNGGAFTLKNNDNAQLIIEDGVQLINNIGGSDGGAIYIARGTVNVGAATISGNHSNWGGAVYVGGGTANFTDTIITENRATGGRGGAFNINKVSSDIATTVNINGNTQIFKNSASAHGGAINIQNGTVNLNGGLISENTAAQNGGAIYLGFTDGSTSGNGTLNLGSSGNDFALTISGNTAAKGDDIYYGENGTFNINAKLNLNNLFLSMNSGKTPNINCDLLGNTPIKVTIASDRVGRDIASKGTNLDEAAYINSLNVFRVYDLTSASGAANSYKSTYKNNNVLSINDTLSLEKELSSSIYLKDIEINLYKVTGANEYTWYVKNADSNEFTEVKDGLDSLSDGTHTVYCVASDGTNYMVSDVAEITVKDFYPCSKAIDKFKNI